MAGEKPKYQRSQPIIIYRIMARSGSSISWHQRNRWQLNGVS